MRRKGNLEIKQSSIIFTFFKSTGNDDKCIFSSNFNDNKKKIRGKHGIKKRVVEQEGYTRI